MHNPKHIIHRLIEKDKDSLNELYDSYILHITQTLKKTGIPSHDHEKMISQLFHMIWSSPLILSKEKHISVAITKLCLKLTKTTFSSMF